jgi:hypothetical protein
VLRASLDSRHALMLMIGLVVALCAALAGLHVHLPMTVGNIWDIPLF